MYVKSCVVVVSVQNAIGNLEVNDFIDDLDIFMYSKRGSFLCYVEGCFGDWKLNFSYSLVYVDDSIVFGSFLRLKNIACILYLRLSFLFWLYYIFRILDSNLKFIGGRTVLCCLLAWHCMTGIKSEFLTIYKMQQCNDLKKKFPNELSQNMWNKKKTKLFNFDIFMLFLPHECGKVFKFWNLELNWI